MSPRSTRKRPSRGSWPSAARRARRASRPPSSVGVSSAPARTRKRPSRNSSVTPSAVARSRRPWRRCRRRRVSPLVTERTPVCPCRSSSMSTSASATAPRSPARTMPRLRPARLSLARRPAADPGWRLAPAPAGRPVQRLRDHREQRLGRERLGDGVDDVAAGAAGVDLGARRLTHQHDGHGGAGGVRAQSRADRLPFHVGKDGIHQDEGGPFRPRHLEPLFGPGGDRPPDNRPRQGRPAPAGARSGCRR